MYRKAEFTLFNILSWLAVIFALSALGLVFVYYFTHMELYRNLALVFIAFSLFFELQIFMYKVTVLEQRMLHLVGLSEQHFRIAQKRAHSGLVMYLILFWLALMGVIFAFTPSP